MIKSLLFGLNIVGLLIFGFFQKSEVNITHNPPAALKPGQEVTVTVEISKSDVSGFAKYQVSLDEGLRIEPMNSAGASFTFNDQKAKFIWMALPTEKKFTLTYRLVAEKQIAGNLNLSSRFSYIYQNERKNFDVPDQNIAVGAAGDIAANRIKESFEEKALNKNSNAVLKREINSAGINQWKVDVILKKNDLSGFAKIEEEIPSGFTVIDLKSSSAVFSLDDQKVKYIWYDVPDNETVTVSYKMLPVIAMDGDTPQITGNFAYLKNEETVIIPILSSAEEMLAENRDTSAADVLSTNTRQNATEIAEEANEAESEMDATEDMAEERLPVETPTEGTPVEKDDAAVADNAGEMAQSKARAEQKPTAQTKPAVTPQPKATNNPIASNRSATDGNIVDVPQPETGVFYRVQIAAGKNNLKQEVFNVLYKYSEGFKLENHAGWFKYTTGYHQVYKSARDDRERITAKYSKFKGPFVTAYNDGERITVQEALMITSQKWYQ